MLLLLASVSLATRQSYDGYSVLRFNASSQLQVNAIANAADLLPNTEIWSRLQVGSLIDVFTNSPGQLISAVGHIPHRTSIQNVQNLIDEQAVASSRRKLMAGTSFGIFADYQDAQDYWAYLEALPGVSRVHIGTTFLGNEIPGFQFGTGPDNIIVQGGTHGREWIVPAVLTYVAEQIAGDGRMAAFLRTQFTFTFVPIVNPDGYAKTRGGSSPDRLWRKNMQHNANGCVGTDVNRNFPFAWGTTGTSNNTCAEDYHGTAPLSAPESRAVFDYIKSLPRVISFLDFHSYGQVWETPYGDKDYSWPAKDYGVLMTGAKAATKALTAVHGTPFMYGPTAATVGYLASGTSVDSAYELGVRWSVGIELRDKGDVGFLLPPSHIVPCGEEMTEALLTYFNFIVAQERFDRGERS